MEKTTEDLSSNITRISTIEQLKMQFHKMEDFSHPVALDYIFTTALSHGINRKDLARIVINQTNLERAYVYHLLSGDKKMTRDKLLIFSIAGRFKLEEVNKLLKYAGEATLYPRKKRDAVIEFAVNRCCSIMETNICLEELGLDILK